MENKVFETKTMKASRYYDDEYEESAGWFWEVVDKQDEIILEAKEEYILLTISYVGGLLDWGKHFVKEAKVRELYDLLWKIKNYADEQKVAETH